MSLLQRLGPNLNAFTLEFEITLLDELKDLYDTYLSPEFNDKKNAALFEGNRQIAEPLEIDPHKFYIVSYNKSPLLWVSNDCRETYDIFKRFFVALKLENHLKKLIDHEKNIVMYCGFFVIGNRFNEVSLHLDYFDSANGYTFLTPLFEIDPRHGNLLYLNGNKGIGEYSYRLGEAIIMGDGFLHSTEPYPQTDNLRVLLCLNVGTDKLIYWDILKRTNGQQSRFMILPCGHQLGTCQCLKPEIDRHAPCHCGSGEKYKICHGPLENRPFQK